MVSSKEIKRRLKAVREEEDLENYGYVVCDRCYSVHKLNEWESPEDYEKCPCGGNFTYIKTIDKIESQTKECELCGATNSYLAEQCSECGKKFENYLLYLESKDQDIEIIPDTIIIYKKKGKKIISTEKYDMQEIVNLKLNKGVFRSDVNFDHGKDHVKITVTENQAKAFKELFKDWRPPIVTCPNEDCMYIDFLKKGDLCPKCGTMSKEFPFTSFNILKDLEKRKKEKNKERERIKRENKERLRKQKLKQDREKREQEKRERLKPCKTCGEMVSTNASKCPHCGEHNPTAKPSKPFKEMGKAEKTFTVGYYIFIIIIAFVIGVIILAFC